MQFIKAQDMRYGETRTSRPPSTSKPDEPASPPPGSCRGQGLSFNNVADTDAALECVKSFTKPACVIVKHANLWRRRRTGKRRRHPQPYDRPTPPTASRPSAASSPSTASAGRRPPAIVERQFVEVIIAPKVSRAARDVVASKANVRLLECGEWPAERSRAGTTSASTAAC